MDEKTNQQVLKYRRVREYADAHKYNKTLYKLALVLYVIFFSNLLMFWLNQFSSS